jgi:hypothetical protein
VHGEDLIVGRRLEQIVVGHRELSAHQQSERPAEREKEQGRADVEEADIGVVDDLEKPPSLGQLPNALQPLELIHGSRQWIG